MTIEECLIKMKEIAEGMEVRACTEAGGGRARGYLEAIQFIEVNLDREMKGEQT